MRKYLISLLAFSFSLFAFPAGVFAQAATLSLDPPTGTFNLGCSFSLKVNLDTGGAQTDGTDAILLYDSSRITANSITNGTIYPDYPGNNIDAQNGKITISGLASVTTAFSGVGALATVNFTVNSSAPTGATQVKFDFDPINKAKTTDSNVVQRATVVDVLNSVVDGNYTIGGGACGTTPISTTAPSFSKPPGQGTVTIPATPSSEFKTLPPAGSQELTFTLAIVGLSLTVLGILGLALL